MIEPNEAFWILMMACIYMHILDDFVLQGICLSDMKQESWWRKQIGYDLKNTIFSNDYICALFIHALEWAIGLNIPIVLYTLYKGLNINPTFLCINVLLNTIIHAFVDNMKANELQINLIEDQLCHFMQIIITVSAFIMRGWL